MRKLPTLGSGAPPIPPVGASGSIAGRQFIQLRSTASLFDLMERFGELKDSKTGDRQAVANAMGKVLRRALAALLREEAAPRR